MMFEKKKILIGCVVTLMFLATLCIADETATIGPRELAEIYVKSLNSKQISDLPLSEDVEFDGPLLDNPIQGKQSVLSFLSEVAPFLSQYEASAFHTSESGACIETVVSFEGMGDESLFEVTCLSTEYGKINSIRLYFDPRPLIENSGGNNKSQ